jgi:hypothetical protein
LRELTQRLLVLGKWYIWIPLARLYGRMRSTRQIVSVWPQGEIGLGPKIVLFMHFDARGVVRAQIYEYLRELKASGREIVFVSNAGRLQPGDMHALQGICSSVIVRRNIGYDFGAWREALDYLGLPRAGTEEVIFANDSELQQGGYLGADRKLAAPLPSAILLPRLRPGGAARRGVRQILENRTPGAREILYRACL